MRAVTTADIVKTTQSSMARNLQYRGDPDDETRSFGPWVAAGRGFLLAVAASDVSLDCGEFVSRGGVRRLRRTYLSGTGVHIHAEERRLAGDSVLALAPISFYSVHRRVRRRTCTRQYQHDALCLRSAHRYQAGYRQDQDRVEKSPRPAGACQFYRADAGIARARHRRRCAVDPLARRENRRSR